MNKVTFSLFFIFIYQMIFVWSGSAQPKPGYLWTDVQSEFTPTAAWILLADSKQEGGSGIIWLRAVYQPKLALSGKERAVQAGSGGAQSQQTVSDKWSVIAIHPGLLDGSKVLYAGALEDGSGNIAFSPVLEEKISSLQHLISADSLREKLLIRKHDLNNLRMQFEAQEDSLKRLRADADIIANLGRIVDLREETDRAKKELVDLNRDITTLNEFITLVKNIPAPSNMLARERQLGKQLQELAEATKQAEANEFARRSKAELELQEQLALVDLTRNEDLDALQRELIRLRKKRIELEKQEL